LGTLRSSYRTARPDASPKPRRRPLLELAAVAIGHLAARLTPNWSALRTLVLSVAGFGCLDTAAYQWNQTFGIAACGVSLLVLEALSGKSDGPS
jgi:hypothetical protein